MRLGAGITKNRKECGIAPGVRRFLHDISTKSYPSIGRRTHLPGVQFQSYVAAFRGVAQPGLHGGRSSGALPRRSVPREDAPGRSPGKVSDVATRKRPVRYSTPATGSSASRTKSRTMGPLTIGEHKNRGATTGRNRIMSRKKQIF